MCLLLKIFYSVTKRKRKTGIANSCNAVSKNISIIPCSYLNASVSAYLNSINPLRAQCNFTVKTQSAPRSKTFRLGYKKHDLLLFFFNDTASTEIYTKH
jgi:hypothetical protein